MKKLAIIAIGMAAVMMACTNKGKTAPGDGSDSDSIAVDSLIAEQAEARHYTTPHADMDAGRQEHADALLG